MNNSVTRLISIKPFSLTLISATGFSLTNLMQPFPQCEFGKGDPQIARCSSTASHTVVVYYQAEVKEKEDPLVVESSAALCPTHTEMWRKIARANTPMKEEKTR